MAGLRSPRVYVGGRAICVFHVRDRGNFLLWLSEPSFVLRRLPNKLKCVGRHRNAPWPLPNFENPCGQNPGVHRYARPGERQIDHVRLDGRGIHVGGICGRPEACVLVHAGRWWLLHLHLGRGEFPIICRHSGGREFVDRETRRPESGDSPEEVQVSPIRKSYENPLGR